MCTVLLPPGVSAIAVNKYININISINSHIDDHLLNLFLFTTNLFSSHSFYNLNRYDLLGKGETR